MTPTELRAAVFENLDNARANGYDPLELSVVDTMSDLQSFAADMEDVAYGDLLPHVEEWYRIEQEKVSRR